MARLTPYRMARWGIVGITLAGLITASTIAVAPRAMAAPVDRSSEAFIRATQQKITESVANGRSLQTVARENGLVLVSYGQAPDVTPLSIGSDYSVATPSILYDPWVNMYYANTSYVWATTAYRSDCPGYSTGNCGGTDGFGIRSSQPIQNFGGFSTICWSNWYGATPYPGVPGCYSAWEWDSSENGITFGFQDRKISSNCSGADHQTCATYGGYRGSLTFSFRKLNSACHQFFARYEHTWSSTSLIGFGVSATGFSVVWSHTSNHQQRTSAAGYSGC